MLEWIFSPNYFGNSLFQAILFCASILIAAVAGKTAHYAMKAYARKASEKSRSKLDDLLVETVEKPLVFFLIIIGAWIGLHALSIPVGIAEALGGFFGVLVTIGTAWIAINLVDAGIKHYITPLVESTDSRLDDQLVPIISRTLKLIIAAVALMVIFSSFGYDLTAVLAGLGIGGLAIAFAAQETISEIFGGVNIFVSKPFVVGDWIESDGVVGTIEKVSLRHTVVRNLDKRKVIVPNSKISKSTLVNISSEPARKIVLNLGLAYETPAKKMHKAIGLVEGIIKSHPGCEKEPAVQFSEFKDSSLNLLVIYFIKDKDNWGKVRHEINMAIKESFEKNKIRFAYPTHLVYLAK